MKNSLEEQLDIKYVVKRNLRQHMKRIMARLLKKVLINKVTISVYSLLSKDDIQDFTDTVFAKRFDRYMQGFDREAVAKMIAYLPAGGFVMGVEELGSMSFNKLPIDISDKSEPEVRAFTTEDVAKSEYVLVDTVVDGAQKVQVSEDELKSFAAFNNIKD